MKISVITVCYNSAKTIRETLDSVSKQDYHGIEHIIVDGASKDDTLDIVNTFPHVATVISEPDKGIYDAMNKGIAAATGDIVGILNSDDFYPHAKVLSTVASAFEARDIAASIGDICFVAPNNLQRITRYYSAKKWHPGKFVRGFMPPHPSFFVYRRYFEELGVYKTDYKIAADYELLIRYLAIHKLPYHYIPEPIVYMRAGGVSNESLKSRYVLNQEIVRACRENGLQTNMLKLSLKYFQKVLEYLPKKAAHAR
jgi:glycosyltransferase involved in cell wall biosynthesis